MELVVPTLTLESVVYQCKAILLISLEKNDFKHLKELVKKLHTLDII